MALTALILFALAAVGGLFLAVRHFQQAGLPRPVVLIHGVVAAAALVLLALAYFGGFAAAGLPLLLLVIAALGGFFLLSFDLRGRRLPSAVVVIHALVAVAGVVTLLLVLL